MANNRQRTLFSQDRQTLTNYKTEREQNCKWTKSSGERTNPQKDIKIQAKDQVQQKDKVTKKEKVKTKQRTKQEGKFTNQKSQIQMTKLQIQKSKLKDELSRGQIHTQVCKLQINKTHAKLKDKFRKLKTKSETIKRIRKQWT